MSFLNTVLDTHPSTYPGHQATRFWTCPPTTDC